MIDKIVEERIGTITEKADMIEVGTGLYRDHFPEAITVIEIGVQATVGPGQGPEQVQIKTE